MEWNVHSRLPVTTSKPLMSPLRRLFPHRPIADAGPNHEHVATDHRCGRHRIVGRASNVLQSGDEVDPSALAEAGVELTGRGINGEQIGIARAHEQPFATAIGPVREPAMNKPEICRPASLPALGIEGPSGSAGSWIEGGDLAERRHGIQHAVHHQRSVLIAAWPEQRIGADDGVVGRCPPPNDLQLADVVLGDLIERRILLAERVAGIVAPFAGRG